MKRALFWTMPWVGEMLDKDATVGLTQADAERYAALASEASGLPFLAYVNKAGKWDLGVKTQVLEEAYA